MSKKTVFRIKLDKVQLPDNHDLYIDIDGRATKIELLKESVLGPSEHAYFYNFDVLGYAILSNPRKINPALKASGINIQSTHAFELFFK